MSSSTTAGDPPTAVAGRASKIAERSVRHDRAGPFVCSTEAAYEVRPHYLSVSIMLVIPAIEIKNHQCYRTVAPRDTSALEVYPSDPCAIAHLWRTENAKTIHVTDYDGLYGGRNENQAEILAIVAGVEIPVMLLARFADVEECRQWLAGGVYRIVVHDIMLRDPRGTKELLDEFGCSRVVAGVISRAGSLCTTWREVEELDVVELAARAREIGFKRLFFTDRENEGVLRGPNFEELSRLAHETTLPITAAGGVATVEHLWRLQELESLGVDSVVIGRALYENRFPCQQLWRDVELERRRVGGSELVSTSNLAGPIEPQR